MNSNVKAIYYVQLYSVPDQMMGNVKVRYYLQMYSFPPQAHYMPNIFCN